MARTPCRRLSAFLLALVFTMGGFVLPDVDALLYHSGHQVEPRDATHVDLPGGCGAHAEHCVLATTVSVHQLGTGLAAALRVSNVAPVAPQPLAQLAPPSAERPLPHQSRAPPAAS